MSIIASVADVSLWLFGLSLLAVQLATYGTGYWLGNRHRGRSDTQPESVAVVVGGMLALLAFVLALTLSFASARFSERRAGTLTEANAIGTAWLRAEAVGGTHGKEISRLLEQYLQVRENFARASRGRAAIDELNRQTSVLQSAIWTRMSAIVAEQPNPITASLMSAVNETFDSSTSERLAFETGLPPQIFWLLIVLSLATIASLGYQLGLRGKPQHTLVLLLCMMWSAVIVDILDLASARLGNFRIDTSPYEWTRQGFTPGVTSPR